MKEFLPYKDQLDLLVQRGMDVGDREYAADFLRRVNYYRLSGYWYPFRQLVNRTRTDDFYPGTRLDDVFALYEFDGRLKAATFSVLAPIELALRALLGHELGRIDPCAHLDPSLLGPTARKGGAYAKWLRGYESELARSREDFVEHHRHRYGGRLPAWAAVEILDWGSLTYLYGFAPRTVQDAVANTCGLSAPQLTSWMKALNLVRNTCAHHGRLFNRVHTIIPKLPPADRHADLNAAASEWNRTFGQLTLIQFLLDRLELGRMRLLPAVVKTFPSVTAVPLAHLGASQDWETASRLWAG
ncbi:abortive infection bacteriophage resistance protein [Actinoalloteichus hymeniacidonis]|uniref:Abortive infection bacteriophage resistance protein n=1 Tax=Actinoalloteichus hymeniacidonis TaxID=340345 RepID=A0AAC9MWY5_9PSEU|nr:abortive infection bacteriophage resistance protein [Actinoalloteichus hymeniacidonis]